MAEQKIDEIEKVSIARIKVSGAGLLDVNGNYDVCNALSKFPIIPSIESTFMYVHLKKNAQNASDWEHGIYLQPLPEMTALFDINNNGNKKSLVWVIARININHDNKSQTTILYYANRRNHDNVPPPKGWLLVGGIEPVPKCELVLQIPKNKDTASPLKEAIDEANKDENKLAEIESDEPKCVIKIIDAPEEKIPEKNRTYARCLQRLIDNFLGVTLDKLPAQIEGTCFALALPNFFICNGITQNKFPLKMDKDEKWKLLFYVNHQAFGIIHDGKQLCSLYGLTPDAKYILTKYIGELGFFSGSVTKLFEHESLIKNKALLLHYLTRFGPIFCTINIFKHIAAMQLLATCSNKDADDLLIINNDNSTSKIERTYFHTRKVVITDKMAVNYWKCTQQLKSSFVEDMINLNDTVELFNGFIGTVAWTGSLPGITNDFYIGLILNQPEANCHDGSHQGMPYFNAPNDCGCFARLKEVKKVNGCYPLCEGFDMVDIVNRNGVLLVEISGNNFTFLNTHKKTPIITIRGDCALIQKCDAMSVNIDNFNWKMYCQVMKNYKMSNTQKKAFAERSRSNSSIRHQCDDDDYDSEGKPL